MIMVNFIRRIEVVKHCFKNIMNNKLIATIIDVVTRVDIITASSSIAYFGLLSIFPAIVILGTLLPYLGLTIDTALKYAQTAVPRSEEHTSELQSRFDLVCRLLLEKKNTNETNL